MNYRIDEQFREFCEFNDLGLPLAHFVASELVEIVPMAESYIDETFNLLVTALGLTDTGFDSLEEILSSAQTYKWP